MDLTSETLKRTLDAPAFQSDYKAPTKFESKSQLDELLRNVITAEPSDIAITAEHPVLAKVDKQLMRFTERKLTIEEVRNIVGFIRGKQDGSAADLLKSCYMDVSYSVVTDRSEYKDIRRRLRVNLTGVYSPVGESIQIIMRVFPPRPPQPHEIGLDNEILAAMTPNDGAVYVVGPTGSGKTTTFGSVMGWIAQGNSRYQGLALAYEAPVEFDLASLSSDRLLIVQMEVSPNNAIKSFEDAVRNALRRAPDLVMVGEMRDFETINAALEFAATGHPLFGTLHSNGVANTIPRMLRRIPEAEKEATLHDIVSTLRTIVFQKLVPSTTGKLIALREWLTLNDDQRSRIESQCTTSNIGKLMQDALTAHGHPIKTAAKKAYESGQISEAVYRLNAADA